MNKIAKLTDEQKYLIPIYINKWRKIVLSTEPINKLEISTAIKEVYKLINRSQPIIFFCNSPTNINTVLLNTDLNDVGYSLNSKVENILINPIEDAIKLKLKNSLWEILRDRLRIDNLGYKLFESCHESVTSSGETFYDFYLGDISFCEGRLFNTLIRNGLILDYCLNLIEDLQEDLKQISNIILKLINNCSQILFYEQICIVYEKLKIYSLDNYGSLHNEEKPAIQFNDGTSFYAYHGNIIPEQYGQIHSSKWKTEWLREVDNHLRDVLILGIGEEKIRRELKTEDKINKVGVLTSEQKSLIPEYRNKWQKIALSTERCDRSLVKEYIDLAYKYLGIKETEIQFFDSPLLAQEYAIQNKLKVHLRKPFEENICKSAYSLRSYIDPRIVDNVKHELQCTDNSHKYYRDNYRYITNPVVVKIRTIFSKVIKCIKPESFIVEASIQDYLSSIFDCGKDKERIEIFIGIIKNCGWIYPYGETCLVSQRPIKIYPKTNHILDSKKISIEYTDGFSV